MNATILHRRDAIRKNAELKFGIRQDQPATEGMLRAGRIQPEAQRFQLRRACRAGG